MSDSELRFQSVWASYGHDGHRELTAFRNAKTFTVGASQICILRGDNGTGKSSLLQAIVGQVPIATGSIEVHSQRSSYSIDLARRRTPSALPSVYLPQRIGRLFPARTAVKTVLHAWGRWGRRYATESAQIALCRELGLFQFVTDILWKHCEHLSGGEAMRLGLLLCFLRDPSLILLDEPTASVSRESKAEVINTIYRLSTWPGRDRFIIAASHDDILDRIGSAVVEFE